jgi:hypothetical protein
MEITPKGGIDTGSPSQQQSAEIVGSLNRIEWLLEVLMALGLIWFSAWIVWAIAPK